MKKIRITAIILAFVVLLLILSPEVFASGTNDAIRSFQYTINKYANILMAFALSTGILVFIIHFIRLANSYDHPFMRRQVQKDIFISGITIAMLGGIGIVAKIIAATALYGK